MRLMKASIAVAVLVLVQACAPTLPENGKIDKVRWLDQNWTADERYWFHHTTQGTATFPVPYEWFVSLEQPTLWLFGDPPMLKDPDYLSRFGFIPSPKTSERGYGYGGSGGGRKYGSGVNYDMQAFSGNPDGLPVGFAITKVKDIPEVKDDMIGLTCAACHTGNIEYKGTSIRINGGPAIIDLEKFRETLVLALVYTKNVPFRFGRFADRVLGENHSAKDEEDLEKKLVARIDKILAIVKKRKKYEKDSVDEGFARLDALNRIGNQVFSANFRDATKDTLGFDPWDNYRATNAPVNFPHIWSTPWFDWVQYDASIMQPMVRNAGEALGVSAKVNLVNPKKNLYWSTVKAREIHDMEQLIQGDNPFVKKNGEPEAEPHFKGLRAPQWPKKILGPINRKWAIEGEKIGEKEGEIWVKGGEELYKDLCQGCHLPPTKSPDFWSTKHWKPIANATGGQRYLKVKKIDIDYLGTDPAQAAVIFERTVKVPGFLEIDPGTVCDVLPNKVVTETLFACALGVVVEKTMDKWYKVNNIGNAERDKMNGYRPNKLRALMKYKARPLNGIWATAPFFHNGSVPNLYDLLSPVSDRPKKFCLGHREFDPEHVGYKFEKPPCPSGTFELDTQKAGNSNKGHEFNKDEGKGIIGRRLNKFERRNLVEYLKTL